MQPRASATAGITKAAKDILKRGLSAPICLTWELTYGCNLSCIHCLSASGLKDPRELNTSQALGLLDSFKEMGIFYVNIGGGEPTIRRDFLEILRHADSIGIGIKFSTNGYFIDDTFAGELNGFRYTDVQISIDGPDRESNDLIRGVGSFDRALKAMDTLSRRNGITFKISTVATRSNVHQLDRFYELASFYRAELRVTRLRPSGRGSKVFGDLNPSAEENVSLYQWLRAHPDVLTGDSFFHLSPLGTPVAGMNICGAGRVVCLVDPIGDVYACPFTIHETFRAGNISGPGGFRGIWENSELFNSMRKAQGPKSCEGCVGYQSCQGGCISTKFFTGTSLDGPDPDCVLGKAGPSSSGCEVPSADLSHSRRVRIKIHSNSTPED